MLKYETLLSFIYFKIFLGGQICSFCGESTLNSCTESFL